MIHSRKRRGGGHAHLAFGVFESPQQRLDGFRIADFAQCFCGHLARVVMFVAQRFYKRFKRILVSYHAERLGRRGAHEEMLIAKCFDKRSNCL